MDQTSSIPSAGKENPPADVDLSGRTLGEFQLLRRVGQGGMGQVYLAEQTSLKRKVALKIMRPELAFDAVSFQRFKAEAEAVARVTHANIVQVYAFGEEGGLHYIALEYVEGRNLREYLARKGTTDTALTLSILRQVAAALQRASELGIIHRDIKPENILLTKRGEVKVADFGLSRCLQTEGPAPNLTQSGLAMGTPLYMSPEQVQGQTLDARTDIYSLGVTCYQMLAGAPPFKGRTAFELATHHVSTPPPPLSELRPDLPAELCAMVHKMMAKDPARRYQTCAELIREVLRVRELCGGHKSRAGVDFSELTLPAAGALTDTAHPASGTEPTPTFSSLFSLLLPALSWKARWAIGGAAVVLALASGSLVAWLRYGGPKPSPAPESHVSVAEKHERFLKDSLEQDTDPGKDLDRARRGLTNRIELGQLYLRQRRLAEADQFFNSLAKSSEMSYAELGQVGHGLVLAYLDKTVDSNALLGEHLQKLSRMGGPLFNNATLRYEIGRALDYNKANATASNPFPVHLERFRLPDRPANTRPR